MRVLDTCVRLLGCAVLLAATALSSVVVGSVQAARVSSTGGGASTLNQAFDGGKTIDGANSEANAFVVGDGTRSSKEWCDATNGCIKKPNPLADSLWRVWTNMNAYIWDEEANAPFATIDPDAFGTGSGTMTFATGEQVVASNLGIEFAESNTNPTCAGGNYTIFADTSEAKLKKCQNGTVSDVSSAGNGDIYVLKAADETLNTNAVAQDDNELIVPVDANSTYMITVMVLYNSPTTADFRYNFSLPAGASGYKATAHAPLATTACSDTSTTTINNSITSADNNVGGAGAVCALRITGTVIVAGTAGNVTFQWAQATSDAGTTTVYANSWIAYRKVS